MSVADFLIGEIGSYIPPGQLDNAPRIEEFDVTDGFLTDKIGTRTVARRAAQESTSDMAVRALEALAAKGVDLHALDALIVVTQNPDGFGLPHTSAIVHARMGLPQSCASFDVGLACSGFVYAHAIMAGFLEVTGKSNGVIVTCDPYSKVIDPDDKATVLLFGDGAAATHVSRDIAAGWRLVTGRYGSEGAGAEFLTVKDDRSLFMNGREVFNFAAKRVPGEISATLEAAGLSVDDIDLFLLHQGSRYIVDALTKRCRLPAEKTPCNLDGLGNTVSSSIPLLLEGKFSETDANRVLMCGFGVGFSFATAIVERA